MEPRAACCDDELLLLFSSSQVQKSYGQPELASRVVAATELPFPGVTVCNQPAESPNLQPSQGNCLITNDVTTAVRQ
jgi:hypothetical protein